jgi:hypothetical protein
MTERANTRARLESDERILRRYSAMLTSPELSAVTEVRRNVQRRAIGQRVILHLCRLRRGTQLPSSRVRAGGGSAGRAASAVRIGRQTITLEKFAPPAPQPDHAARPGASAGDRQLRVRGAVDEQACV